MSEESRPLLAKQMVSAAKRVVKTLKANNESWLSIFALRFDDVWTFVFLCSPTNITALIEGYESQIEQLKDGK